ncbi:uncharacterized protein LOC113279172 [Papaver somniferum]|uniref:uncharacterized protein LOC113279172 n=1 Tax=Papaver somniferum TaxID=3469 RepID=UPI000E6F4FE1|nr:uncharacterized protein LOC113279172 [Papaver somniferum]
MERLLIEKQQLTSIIDSINSQEENGALTSQQFIKRVESRSKLNQLNLNKTRKWLVRSKTKHFKEGDANTKYFHSLANGRRRRNTIQKLVIEGEDNFCQADIREEISKYFFNLFKEEHKFRPQMNEEFTKISSYESSWVERPIEEEEIWLVIKNCKNNKSPGPDSYNMEFYKATWEGAFIADKQILDSILIAGELIDSRLKSKDPGIICKLDIQKSFDNVSWHTISQVLHSSGFVSKWINWMEWCTSLAQHSLLINGSSTPKFKPQKGLRQGDSLSPFLFILVAEIFTKLMKNAVHLNMISGFSVNSIKVSHLQFADDTLVFLDAKEEEAENLVLILQIFEAIIGLSVNFSKSDIISIGTDHKVDVIADILNCRIEKFPLKYLGIPIGATSRSTTIWDVIIEFFLKKLAPSKRRFFNKADRVVLIKATLPTYQFTLCPFSLYL